MTSFPQSLTCNPASLDGLSAKLVTSHHEHNYGGAVKRLNAIRPELATFDWATVPGFTVSALKRGELMAGTLPILALDMYEHSYHMDYGANAGAYVDAFMRNIDWDKA
ncbi:MAG: Fe-Mn family superoxide dismutase, partial [Burkholderiales bacterium]